MKNQKSPPKLIKFPAAKQRRLDELLDKNSEGRITAAEKMRLEQLVTEAEQLMGANAQRLALYSQREDRHVTAVPVTVWVAPVPEYSR